MANSFNPADVVEVIAPTPPEDQKSSVFDPSQVEEIIAPFDPSQVDEVEANPDVIGPNDTDDKWKWGYLKQHAWKKKKDEETWVQNAENFATAIPIVAADITKSAGKVVSAGQKIMTNPIGSALDLASTILPEQVGKPLARVQTAIDAINPIAKATKAVKEKTLKDIDAMPEGMMKSALKSELDVIEAKPSPTTVPEAAGQLGEMGVNIAKGTGRAIAKVASTPEGRDQIAYDSDLEAYAMARRRAAGQSIIGDVAEAAGLPRETIDKLTDQEQAFVIGLLGTPQAAVTKVGSLAIRAIRGGKVAEAMEIARAAKMADAAIEAGKAAIEGAAQTSGKAQKAMNLVQNTLRSPSSAVVLGAGKAAQGGARVAEEVGKFATEHPNITNAVIVGAYPALRAAEGEFKPSDLLVGLGIKGGLAGAGRVLAGVGVPSRAAELAETAAARQGALRTLSDVLKGTGQAIRVGGAPSRAFSLGKVGAASEEAQKVMTIARGIQLTGQAPTTGQRLAGWLAQKTMQAGGYVDDMLHAGATGWLMGYLSGAGSTETANAMAAQGSIIGLGAHGMAKGFAGKYDPVADMNYITERMRSADPMTAQMIKHMIDRGAPPSMLASLLEESNAVKGKADIIYHTDQPSYTAAVAKFNNDGKPVTDSEANSNGFFIKPSEASKGRAEIHVNLAPTEGRAFGATSHEIGHFFDQVQGFLGTDKNGKPIGDDLFLQPQIEFADALIGPMAREMKLPIEERGKQALAEAPPAEVGAVPPKLGRYSEADILQMWSEYQTRMGRNIDTDPNGVPVLKPEAIAQWMGEMKSDTYDQFFRRSVETVGSKGKVEYAKRVAEMSDESLQALIDHSKVESVLFHDPQTGEAVKPTPEMERAIAKMVLAHEGFTKPITPGKSDLAGHITITPSEQVAEGKRTRDAVRQAEYTGDQTAIDEANTKLNDLIKTGIYYTLPKDPKKIRAEAAQRAKRLNAGREPTETEIAESVPFIPDREMAISRTLPMMAGDAPVLVSRIDQARRDAAVAKAFSDALLTVPAATPEEGLVPHRGKEGTYFIGTRINNEQMDALMKLDSSVNPEGLKRIMRFINDQFRTNPGGAMSSAYFPASKARGNIVKTYRVFSPTSFFISQKGNPSIVVFDRTRFNGEIQHRINLELETNKEDPYFRPFKEAGDTDPMQKVDRFMQAVFTYTENHSRGEPGARGLDTDAMRAIEKRNALNGFFGISKEDVNPLASENNFYRMFRLDRMMDLKSRKDLNRLIIKYGPEGERYQAINFMPAVAEPPAAGLLREDLAEQAKWMREGAVRAGYRGPTELQPPVAMAKGVKARSETTEKIKTLSRIDLSTPSKKLATALADVEVVAKGTPPSATKQSLAPPVEKPVAKPPRKRYSMREELKP